MVARWKQQAALFAVMAGWAWGGCGRGDGLATGGVGTTASDTGTGGGVVGTQTATASSFVGTTRAPEGSSGLEGGDTLQSDIGVDGGAAVPLTCVMTDELPLFGACDRATPIDRTVRTVIDLRAAPGFAGRCDDTTDVGAEFFNAYELPTEPAAYPLLIHLSAKDFSGVCTVCSNFEGITTAYGVGFRVRECAQWDRTGQCSDGGLDEPGLVLGMRVNEPWRVGAGGCGEACSWPCASGYQEFVPATCAATYSLDLGVHTTMPDPPDAMIYVDLVPASFRTCCPFACA